MYRFAAAAIHDCSTTSYYWYMLSATLERPVVITGNGLFSGAPCRAEIHPAPPAAGIVFIRDGVRIAVHPDNYIDSPNCSILGHDGASVAVTEHLLAALWAAGIDTAEITVSGPEVPNQDGSARPLYDALQAGGRVTFAPRPALLFVNEIKVAHGNTASLEILPDTGLCIGYGFNHRELGSQNLVTAVTREWAVDNILPARTFITEQEALAARRAGLLQHDDESAALLIRNGVPATPLRFENEYARHKILDLLGDLYAVPAEVSGNIIAARSGHALNRALARVLAKQPLAPGNLQSAPFTT